MFPKAFVHDLVVTGAMSLRQWVGMAASLDVDGLEFYGKFRDLQDPAGWIGVRRMVEDHGLSVPMLCCSPDFTSPDPVFRQAQVDQEKRWIDMAAALGGRFCRVLSGQRRPEVSREDGLAYAAGCIAACAAHAHGCGITLVIENHYKDQYWEHPEFAQRMDVFCELLGRLPEERVGVNYDPSNTMLAGEDPLELLGRVKSRVATMHASDRYLAEGTVEDLRREEDTLGYARRLRHGVIGRGMNDYDAIFRELSGVGFDGWISIEDGEHGMDELKESVTFLRDKMAHHWPAPRKAGL